MSLITEEASLHSVSCGLTISKLTQNLKFSIQVRLSTINKGKLLVRNKRA